MRPLKSNQPLDRLEQLREEISEREKELLEVVKAARAMGIPAAKIAKSAGVTRVTIQRWTK